MQPLKFQTYASGSLTAPVTVPVLPETGLQGQDPSIPAILSNAWGACAGGSSSWRRGPCVGGLDLGICPGVQKLGGLVLGYRYHMEPCGPCHTLRCVSSLSQSPSWLECLNFPLKLEDVRVVGVPSYLSSPCFLHAPPHHCSASDWVTAALAPAPDCPASS